MTQNKPFRQQKQTDTEPELQLTLQLCKKRICTLEMESVPICARNYRGKVS